MRGGLGDVDGNRMTSERSFHRPALSRISPRHFSNLILLISEGHG